MGAWMIFHGRTSPLPATEERRRSLSGRLMAAMPAMGVVLIICSIALAAMKTILPDL